jgi:hypothetical protein
MRNIKEKLEAHVAQVIEKVVLSYTDNYDNGSFLLIDDIPYPEELIILETEE